MLTMSFDSDNEEPYVLGGGPMLWDPLDLDDLPGSSGIVELSLIDELFSSATEILADNGVTANPEAPVKALGMEVGDDRVDLCQNPTVLALALAGQESVFQMKTSQPDTFISARLWNFCETTSQIPQSPEGSFEWARKNNFGLLEFTDVPPFRIVIDVQKGDRSHSSTVSGKATMLASRMNSVRTENWYMMQRASWIQDACLNTKAADEPKYIDKMFGGSGAPPLFGESLNTYLYMVAYKGGTYSRVYGSAINEAKNTIDRWETKGISSPCILSARLREKQEYLHGTYADKVMVGPRQQTAGGLQLPEPLIEEAHGSSPLLQGVEQRLLAAKRLATRNTAVVELQKTFWVTNMLFSTHPSVMEQQRSRTNDSRKLAKEYGFALRANSAFKRLLDRKASGQEVDTLITEFGFKSVDSGVKELTKALVYWQHEGKGQVLTLRDLTVVGELYAFDEVDSGRMMKVPHITLRPDGTAPDKAVVTTTGVGLWQISGTMEEWADRTTSHLKEFRRLVNRPLSFQNLSEVLSEDREWVSDDTLLIAECIRDTEKLQASTTVYLISSDRRLGRQMAHTTNNFVVVVDPTSFIYADGRMVYDSSTDISVERMVQLLDPSVQVPTIPASKVYLDTGSLTHACSNLESGESDEHGKVYSFTRRSDPGSANNRYRPRASFTVIRQIVGTRKIRSGAIRIFTPGTRRDRPDQAFPSVNSQYWAMTNPIFENTDV